jgi:hypothetical protein
MIFMADVFISYKREQRDHVSLIAAIKDATNAA